MRQSMHHKKNGRVWIEYCGSVLLGFPNINRSFRYTVLLSPKIVLDSWVFRYSARRVAINSMRLADRAVLVARNRVLFEQKNFHPQHQFLHSYPVIGEGFQADRDRYNIRFVEANHPEYGPLLQSFVVAAANSGLTDAQMCESLKDWALAPPKHWTEFLRRSEYVDQLIRGGMNTEQIYYQTKDPTFVKLLQNGGTDRRQAKHLEEFKEGMKLYFDQCVTFHLSGILDYPWIARVGTCVWRLRLNDFPDEILYTLFVEDKEINHFNDFPSSWKRSKRPLTELGMSVSWRK